MLRLCVAPRLAGIMVLGFVSFAMMIAVRGVWGGPWLMDQKHLTRMEAGATLLWLTLALIIGPVIAGTLDRRLDTAAALLRPAILSPALYYC